MKCIFFNLIVVIIALGGCNAPSVEVDKSNRIEQNADKNESISAEEFVRIKRDEGADTVIYCRRVCLNCCEFYNVFWTKDGKQNFNNFYWQVVDSNNNGYTRVMQTQKVDLLNDSIFIVLKANYGKFKKDSIVPVFNSMSHYCYTELAIYTKGDSIVARMSDYDFVQPGIIGDLNDKERETEMKKSRRIYQANKSSAWNKLQMEVEKEIMYSPGIGIDEQEHQRMYYDKP